MSELRDFQSFLVSLADSSIFSAIRHSLTLNLHAIPSCAHPDGLVARATVLDYVRSLSLPAPIYRPRKTLRLRGSHEHNSPPSSGLFLWQMGN